MAIEDIAFNQRVLGLAREQDAGEAMINANYYSRFSGTGMSTSSRKMALARLGGKIAGGRQEAQDQREVERAARLYQEKKDALQAQLMREQNKTHWYDDVLPLVTTAAAFI